MGQGGKGWRRCQACRLEREGATVASRSLSLSLRLRLSPALFLLIVLTRPVSVTPPSLFVPSFLVSGVLCQPFSRLARSTSKRMVGFGVWVWVGGGEGRGGARLGGQRVPCPRSVLVTLIRAAHSVPMFETGFRTPRFCIRRKYGFVRTRVDV